MKYIGPLIAFVIALGIAFFLMLVAQDTSPGQGVPPIEPSVYDKKLLRLDRRGVEAAYAARISLLFQNWMTDTNKESQDRALRGHRKAREIYIKVMTGLDERDPEGATPEDQARP